MTVIALTRTFRMGATDLPDPDPDLTPEQVVEFYGQQHPTLRGGKVEDLGIEGDRQVFAMKPTEYKRNG